jgi:hypothetical protein
MRARLTRLAQMSALAAVLALAAWSCGEVGSFPMTPLPESRVVGLHGSLAFGDVPVGQTASLTLTVTNSGKESLSCSGMTFSSDLGGFFSSTFTAGAIAAGGSQTVTIRFAPSAAGSYSGTITVNCDHTSGTNTAPVSGTGTTTATYSLNGTVGMNIRENAEGLEVSLEVLVRRFDQNRLPAETGEPTARR